MGKWYIISVICSMQISINILRCSVSPLKWVNHLKALFMQTSSFSNLPRGRTGFEHKLHCILGCVISYLTLDLSEPPFHIGGREA